MQSGSLRDVAHIPILHFLENVRTAPDDVITHYTQITKKQHLLFQIKNSGCIIIGYQDEQPAGMLIARIMEDPWLPHVRTLKEMAWWVEPEHRGSTVGYRLLKEYVKTGEAMKASGVIENFTLTLMTESPDFDLEKRGWRSVETNYVFEGRN